MSILSFKVFLHFFKYFIDDIKVIIYNDVKGGYRVNTAKKVKMAIAYAEISEAALARRTGTSPQSFNQKMKTDKWSDKDLKNIAAALGAEIALEFRFSDGTVI
jgi:hypothetical protein